MKLIVQCNDGNNGAFLGQFEALHIQLVDFDEDILLVAPRPISLSYPKVRQCFKIGRKWFTLRNVTTWPGSWACDEIQPASKEVMYQVVKYLQELGLEIEEGAENFDKLLRMVMGPPEKKNCGNCTIQGKEECGGLLHPESEPCDSYRWL